MAPVLHYLYVLRCADGTFYTGYSTDPERRCATHNRGAGAKYTRSRRPVALVAQVSFPTRHEALSAEWHFKRLARSQKASLVARYQADRGGFEAAVRALAGPEAPGAGSAPRKR